jgi:hypothetical protein
LQASRPTEELYNAIVKNDLAAVYEKIEAGADVNFVFGPAYSSPEGYTPLMVACHRGRVECAKALLRAGECCSDHSATLFVHQVHIVDECVWLWMVCIQTLSKRYMQLQG